MCSSTSVSQLSWINLLMLISETCTLPFSQTQAFFLLPCPPNYKADCSLRAALFWSKHKLACSAHAPIYQVFDFPGSSLPNALLHSAESMGEVPTYTWVVQKLKSCLMRMSQAICWLQQSHHTHAHRHTQWPYPIVQALVITSIPHLYPQASYLLNPYFMVIQLLTHCQGCGG